ncbi:MAG: Na(+)-translocating NADH-quinone reductase subunit A [Planctomycetota bacterium]|nr:Na(+)-translocating NADH-quinone reductase subunit A [Planctomycetota bacterium]
MKRITKGLDVPIANPPEQKIYDGPEIRTVALVGTDYIGLKPTMEVAEGDTVRRGTLLFTDKKNPGVRFTSPAAGTVRSINRGAKRAFQSIIIDADGDDAETFRTCGKTDVSSLSRAEVVSNLVDSGLWTSLRQRPFSRIPSPDSEPHSIFITATDTNPLCAKPEVIIAEREHDFRFGVRLIRRLTNGKVFLVSCPGVTLPGEELSDVDDVEFDGPHPAGLVGTHIHFLDPVSATRNVWHVNYQDVIAIGHLFLTGTLDAGRVISLAGPAVSKPRLIRTRLGASISELTSGELAEGDIRVISGSVLSGRAVIDGPFGFLSRYHLQVSALIEGREREFLGWQKPGLDKFSLRKIFASAFLRPSQKYNFTTSTGGSKRAMVPIGMYEDVMPLDIIPTFLLRSLITGDTDQASALGALELDEEDLALCTFVCPGKYEYGSLLRKSLAVIEKEG